MAFIQVTRYLNLHAGGASERRSRKYIVPTPQELELGITSGFLDLVLTISRNHGLTGRSATDKSSIKPKTKPIAMSSSSSQYPPPPAEADAPTDAQQPPIDQQPQHQHPQSIQSPSQHHHQVSLQYDGLPSATAVAHHGLQALEAASAAVPVSPNPIAQHYAQSASMHVSDGQYPLVPHPSGSNGTPPTPNTPASQKVTRLRRACDMCSQRKVKVSLSPAPQIFRSRALFYEYGTQSDFICQKLILPSPAVR